eukprot:SAG11_NODE_5594_length_1515_cov_1.192797_1_plen_73_part_00
MDFMAGMEPAAPAPPAADAGGLDFSAMAAATPEAPAADAGGFDFGAMAAPAPAPAPAEVRSRRVASKHRSAC